MSQFQPGAGFNRLLAAVAGAHPSPDAIELYVMDRLGTGEAERLEEHLLCCRECQAKVQKTEQEMEHLRRVLRFGCSPPTP